MATKQTVAIIGATGKEGSAIAKNLAKGPYRILLMGNNAEKLQVLHNNISTELPPAELEMTDCPKEACWEADLIIFAIPWSTETKIAPVIRQYATGKVVIDIRTENTGNDVNQQDLQILLPNSKVVKAVLDFSGSETPRATEISIEGKDEDALKCALEVLKAAGFSLQNDKH